MTRPLFFTVWNYNLVSPLVTLQKCQNTGVCGPQSEHGDVWPSKPLVTSYLGKEHSVLGDISWLGGLFISITVFYCLLKGFDSGFLLGFVCFVSWIVVCLFFFIFFWTICYTFHNQTMLKFYFNTMTKTRFTLKYSRIHSAQACGSKAEWKTKAKLLYKELAFPFSPLPSPWKFLYFPPPTWFPIQESCILTPDGIYFVLFLFLFFTNVA